MGGEEGLGTRLGTGTPPYFEKEKCHQTLPSLVPRPRPSCSWSGDETGPFLSAKGRGNATPDGCHGIFSGTMSEELVRFLKSASIPTEGNNLLTTLENLGVENLDDLEFLEGGDLEDSGACMLAPLLVLLLIYTDYTSVPKYWLSINSCCGCLRLRPTPACAHQTRQNPWIVTIHSLHVKLFFGRQIEIVHLSHFAR